MEKLEKLCMPVAFGMIIATVLFLFGYMVVKDVCDDERDRTEVAQSYASAPTGVVEDIRTHIFTFHMAPPFSTQRITCYDFKVNGQWLIFRADMVYKEDYVKMHNIRIGNTIKYVVDKENLIRRLTKL